MRLCLLIMLTLDNLVAVQDNTDEEIKVCIKGATRMTIVFDSRSRTEAGMCYDTAACDGLQCALSHALRATVQAVIGFSSSILMVVKLVPAIQALISRAVARRRLKFKETPHF